MAASFKARGSAKTASCHVAGDAFSGSIDASLFGWLVQTAIYTMVEAGLDAAGRLWSPSTNSAPEA